MKDFNDKLFEIPMMNSKGMIIVSVYSSKIYDAPTVLDEDTRPAFYTRVPIM